MNSLKILAASTLLLTLAACEDKGPQTTTPGQASPEFTQFHANDALEQLKMQVAMNPQDANALNQLGDLYFESGQYFDAIISYDRALAIDPQCADCLNTKGLAQFYTGDVEGALVSFDGATTADPAYPNAWLSWGYVLMSVGRHEEAIAPLSKVAAVDPTGTLAAEAERFLGMIEEQRAAQ